MMKYHCANLKTIGMQGALVEMLLSSSKREVNVKVIADNKCFSKRNLILRNCSSFSCFVFAFHSEGKPQAQEIAYEPTSPKNSSTQERHHGPQRNENWSAVHIP